MNLRTRIAAAVCLSVGLLAWVDPTAHADVIIGGTDAAFGTNGNDTISAIGTFNLFAKSGKDRIYGSTDAVFLFGGSGPDNFQAGDGNDRIHDDDGRSRRREKGDVIAGEDGDDVVFSVDGEVDEIACGSGLDTVFADRRDETKGCEFVVRRSGSTVVGASLHGSRAADTLTAGPGPMVVFGNAGDDTLTTDGSDVSVLLGGPGVDNMTGGPHLDQIIDDDGTPGDVVSSGAEDDFIYVADGAPTTVDCGAHGSGDWVYYDAGVDTIVNCENAFGG